MHFIGKSKTDPFEKYQSLDILVHKLVCIGDTSLLHFPHSLCVMTEVEFDLAGLLVCELAKL